VLKSTHHSEYLEFALLLIFLVSLSGHTAQCESEAASYPNTSQTEISAPSPTQETGPSSSNPVDPMLAPDRDLVEHGDYPDAARNLSAYLADHAASADAHFLLGYVLYREDKPRESLAEYTAGAHLRKPDANDLAVVAMDYILLHDYADADKWLSIATAWRPENELYWYYLGRTKYNENRFQEAADAFRKCLTLQPRDVRAEYNLGLAFAGMGHNDDAVSAYQSAIAWEEHAAQPDPQPYLDLGILFLQQGHADQALPYLRKSVAIDASNPRIHEELGRAYEQLRDFAEAAPEIEKAISLAPNVPSLHFEMGRIYEKEGMTSKAKEEFARCSALNATHSTDSAETPNQTTAISPR
jgi:tetratricopeptide (TPR) repeat protein